MKAFALILSLILCAPAFGQEAPDCGEVSGGFEVLAQEFVKNWSGQPDYCEFKKFTVLNEMIAQDMEFHPAQYAARMAFIQSLKPQRVEAVNFLLISFQETWFNTYIDSILLREEGRSSPWARWLTLGAAGTAVGMVALPWTKKYSTKVVRFFKTGLKHFMQKRAITFGSTSVTSQAERLSSDRQTKKPKEFVQPPLYFGDDADIMDQRTYNVFLNEIQNDVLSAGAGVFGGWALGHGSSVVVRDRVAKSWADTALGRFGWTQNKIAKFASPGMIVGFAVTFYATNKISEVTSEYMFQKRFGEIRASIENDLRVLRAAVLDKKEFQVYTAMNKLKNDVALYNFLLTRELSEELAANVESAGAKLLNDFQYCLEPREVKIKRARKRFFKTVASIVESRSRDLKAALLLAQSAQQTLTEHPHRLTKSLLSVNHKLMMRTHWMLDPVLTAADMWEDVVKNTKDQPVNCVDMTYGMPL